MTEVTVSYDLAPARVEEKIRQKLIETGWTPPGDESVQDQLCARIDELERDKEVLAAQLDQAEEEREEARTFLGDQKELNGKLAKRVDALAAHVEVMKRALKHHRVIHDYLTCEDGEARQKRAHEEMEAALTGAPETSLTRLKAEAIESLRFPVMLRKVWSGGQVQRWLTDQAEDVRRQAEGGES